MSAASSWVRSVRGRTVLFGLVIVAVTLVVAGTMFDRSIRAARLRELERSAVAQISETRADVQGVVPQPLPAPRDSPLLVQLVGANDQVLSSSASVMDMKHPFASAEDRQRVLSGKSSVRLSVDGARYLVVGEPLRAGSTEALFVAAPLSDADRLERSLRSQMLWWFPALLAATGLGMALVVSRALRPVERMRQQVAAIQAHDLAARIPTTGTADELERLATTMNQLLERLQSSTLRQQRFVSDASHELRTPLAVMRTKLEVSLRNQVSVDWPTVGESLLATSSRMERLVDGLLALAKGAGRGANSVSSPVDLDELIQACVRDLRVTHPDVRFDLRRVSAGRVLGTLDELERLLQNVLSNAATYGRGVVRVSLGDRVGDVSQVEFSVEDDGPGIDVDDRERVFERFTRLDAARSSASGGAGLGLAIAREIAVRHGGTLGFADPQELRGARVVARFAKVSS